MEYGCIGEKLSHSYSKEIHAKIGAYKYELCEVAKDKLSEFMTERRFKGINVTIPYKQDVIPFLYEIEPNAARIGAVNTVVNRGGRLYGYNTDFAGMRATLEKSGISPKGKKVLILGTGGTSKTAAALCEELGADIIIKVSRSGKEGAVSYDECIKNHSDAEVIINTTPCGMYPDTGKAPIDISFFSRLSGVADVIYNPLRTRLIQDAQRAGIACACGLYMLVAQAVFAADKFTCSQYGAETCARIYKEVLYEKENIVLTGMPASGKTSIAKRIAEDTGRKFIDTDAEIEKKAKMSITEIFEKYGEAEFRKREAEAAEEAGRQNGAVIATGGGIILRQENIDALKQNGRIYFINRPLENLVPTSDRPLASTYEDIKKRFEERAPLYLKTADEKVDIGEDIAENARLIEMLHRNGERYES